MPLTITDDKIISNCTEHYATVRSNGMWRVSWLPGIDYDRNAAITAMTLAECASEPHTFPETRELIDALTAELGVCVSDAILLACAPPLAGVRFTSMGGIGRDGMIATLTTHEIWFDTPEAREEFTKCDFVASYTNMEDGELCTSETST